jgi:hypothetical protein
VTGLDYTDFQPDPTNCNVQTVVDGVYTTFGTIYKACLTADVDAALIKVNPGVTINPQVKGIGSPGLRSILNPVPNLPVQGYGSVSRNMTGSFSGASNSIVGPYFPSPGLHPFNELYGVVSQNGDFSSGGDSGSLVFDNSMGVFGMIVLLNNHITYCIPANMIEKCFTLNF